MGPQSRKFKIGDRVRTKELGPGTVIGVVEDIVTVHRDGEPQDGSGAAIFRSHDLAPLTEQKHVLASRN
jgi:hypothetical protein